MHGHLPGNPHPDGRHLALPGPDAGVSLLGPGVNAEVGERGDQDFLETPHVGDYLLGVVEGEDGIADQLARPVEGDVPATIDVMHLCPGAGDRRPIGQQVGAVAVAPDGEHGRVLDQEQVVVGGAPLDPPLVEGALEVPCLGVGQTPEPAGTQERHASSCSQSQVCRLSLMRFRNRTAVDPSNAR